MNRTALPQLRRRRLAALAVLAVLAASGAVWGAPAAFADTVVDPTACSAPGPGGGNGTITGTSAYTLDGGTQAFADRLFTADDTNETAVLVSNGGTLSLLRPTVVTSGNTESADDSSFYGLNAAVRATETGSGISIRGGSITTTGSGANALHAEYNGSITMTGGRINVSGQFAHPVLVSHNGSAVLRDVDMVSTACHGSVVATDQGDGTVDVYGGRLLATGKYSTVLYATGTITAHRVRGVSKADNAVVMAGTTTTVLADHSDLTGAEDGVQGFAMGASSNTLTVRGGSITAEGGPVFDFSGGTTVINVSDGAKLRSATDQLVTVAGGGTVTLSASDTRLEGTITGAALALSDGAAWSSPADSALTAVTGLRVRGGEAHGITSAHTVTYDASLAANAYLGGRAYALAGGGTLTPAS
ncbi:hypothetical protein ABZY09_14445 [Streptomyces sp. NPDC002928]|uniref:hypothetical protein n=1 Tax=Streptomyces sp. NPDC002928 TaxID=3154440 RepID=UPI0033A1C975